MNITLTAPCNFGLEAILAREIRDLGLEVGRISDGRVDFLGDYNAICSANIWLRSAERILVKVGEFTALTFEELFQNTKDLPWENWLCQDSEFPVAKASSIKSKLFSTSDIQAITKKAIVERLKTVYHLSWFPESGPRYTIQVFINKDLVQIYLDSSGISLHKRGYRQDKNIAPIKETLAYSLVALTPWNHRRLLVDPLCGSGTILIEAALKGINKAPGLNNNFAAEKWPQIATKTWREERAAAEAAICTDLDFLLQGYDIDERVLQAARHNAEAAGVAKHIHFQKRDVRELRSKDKYGFIVTNPPYGKRLGENDAVEELYKDLGKVFRTLDTWSYNIITACEDFERLFKRRADKKRKLYNGMIKTYLYQYFGPKPPKK
ncbi:MAG: THUMP domain-containing class I SAM-dependent RNA methyltransferase [Bacillota bacterium]|jgi:putative N6-adenine-specific DNA methylase